MKRRWLSVVLMAWASIVSLISYVPSASSPTAEAADTYSFTSATKITAGGGTVFTGSGTSFMSPTTTCHAAREVGGLSYTIKVGAKIAGGGYKGTITANLSGFNCFGTIDNGAITIDDPNAVGPNGGSKTTPPAPTTPAAGTQPTCDAGSMTWVICPLISVAQKTITWLEKLVDAQLKFDPLDANNPAKPVWDVFHNLANVILILIFFAIIFGTAFGLDNYTVKKSLPRLVAASVLIQLSFYIAAVLVDITNVLGGGLSALAATIPGAPKGNGGLMQFTGLFEGIGLLGLGVGALLILPEIAIPALAIVLSAAISLMTVLLILELRILVIELLIVISPLAFALWVLPNTEKYFKMWWEMFTKMLLMYPMIVLLFIAGDLASIIIKGQNNGGGANSVIRPLMASLAPIIAFFLVPSTFKFAGKAFSQGASFISGATGKLNSAQRKGTDAWYKNAKEGNQDKANEKYAGHLLAGTQNSLKGRMARVQATSNPFNYKNPKGLNKRRLEGTAEKTLEEHAAAEAKDADRLKYEGKETLDQAKNRMRDAELSKLQDSRAAQRAQSVRDDKEFMLNDDGSIKMDADGNAIKNPTYNVNIASMPLDAPGIEWLKEQVRNGDEDTKIAALGRLSGSQGGINGIMELRTGKKILKEDQVLSQDTDVFNADGSTTTMKAGQTAKEGMRVAENYGEKRATGPAYSMGGDDNAVVSSDGKLAASDMKQVWDKGTANAKGMDLVKPISAAAVDLSPEDVAGMSVHEMRRYLDYYQRGAEKGDAGAIKAAEQFNASFQTAQTTPVLKGKMLPESVNAVASAAAQGSPVIKAATAQLATARAAELSQTTRLVSGEASRQIYAAAGDDIVHASAIHSHIEQEIKATGTSTLQTTLEQKILSGGTIEAADIASVKPAPGAVSHMPDHIREQVQDQLKGNLDQLAQTHQAYEENRGGYRDMLHQAVLNPDEKGKVKLPPPPMPRPAPKPAK